MIRPRRPLVRTLSLLLALVLSVGTVLSLSPAPTRAASLENLQKQLSALVAEENAIRSKLSSYKNDAAKQQEYADQLKAKINNSQQQIDLLEEQIDLLNKGMEEKSDAIVAAEQTITDKTDEIAQRLDTLGERLRVIAQSGNMSELQMLLDTNGYVDFLLRANVVARIADNDQRMIDDLNDEIEQLDGEKTALGEEKSLLEQQRQEVETLKADADAKMAELDALYAECRAVLKKLQMTVDEANAELAQKKKQADSLDSQIRQLLLDAAAESAKSEKYNGSSMYWPVPAVHALSDVFGPRWGTMHRGIDIANGPIPIYGKKVVAAADGRVIYANKSGWGGGYGLFVMVDHGYDARGRQIVTLYAHMSAVSVNVGDRVVGGTSEIGRVGSTGEAYGPHLHFEVRVDGTAVDPIANGYVSV